MTAIAPSPPTIPLPQTPLLTPPSVSSPNSTPTPSLTTGQTRPKVQWPVTPSSPLRQSTLPTLPESIQLQEGQEGPALALKAHPTRGIPSTLAIPSNPLPPPMSIGGLAGLGPGFSLTPRHGPPPASLIRFPPAPPPTLEFHPPEAEGSKPAFGSLGAAFGGADVGGGAAGGGGGEWSMPNSLRDLQSLSRSVGPSLIPPVVKPTKLAPSPISPVSPGRLDGDGVREKRGMMDIGESGGFERRLAEIELELKGQRSDPSSSGERSLAHPLSARSRPFLESTRDDESTIKGTLLSQNDGNELIGRVRRRNDNMLETVNGSGNVNGGQAIDEVDVEWCFFCGEEGKREKGGMELKQAGEGLGWQWVCGECSKRS
ncbi:hypothetical protein I350_04478 [Cryptococcus amylolentus CBS 6273]|nr:hypothetical protein I350_04478 [Cryptococcus amylolentus CBS 6273]